jgi:hypothetical protein
MARNSDGTFKKADDSIVQSVVPPRIDTGAKIVGGRGRNKPRPVNVLSTGTKTPEPKGVEVHSRPR